MTTTVTEGRRLIMDERRRQREEEGYSTQEDDWHHHQEDCALLKAAKCYLAAQDEHASLPKTWPWHPSYWKPKDRVRNLVRAGALFEAELDCLYRSPSRTSELQWLWNRDESAKLYAQLDQVVAELDALLAGTVHDT